MQISELSNCHPIDQQMHEIRPIGTFFQLDAAGYILNPCQKPPFGTYWDTMLAMICARLQESFPQSLHSIWLRGSVAWGNAVRGQADLDVFALLNEEGYRWVELPDLQPLQKKLSPAKDFLLDCQLESFKGKPTELRSPIAMLIATQSVCIWGEDIQAQLKKYRPGREVMLEYRWIAADVEDWLTKIRKNEKLETAAFRALMKSIIRAGFELVMERDGRYTRDLYPCYQVYSQYYPEKESGMRQALYWYLNPIPDREVLRQYLLDFGRWLVGEVEREGERE